MSSVISNFLCTELMTYYNVMWFYVNYSATGMACMFVLMGT